MTEIQIAGETLILSPKRVAYFPKYQSLLLADLHLGKVSHFRKMGYPIPNDLMLANLERLEACIETYRPERVIFLGDLFHSDHNNEWENFGAMRHHFARISFELVQGNHDILPAFDYKKFNLKIHPELKLGNFLLTHEPLLKIKSGYNLCGHVHPAVVFSGKGRQQVKLSCFYFGEKQGILPPFGALTGKHRINPKKMDRVFAILEDQLFEPKAEVINP